MMKKTILLLIMVLQTIVVGATSAIIDGIYYELNGTERTALLVSIYNQDAYSGTFNIPATVSYNGVVYDVTSIRTYAFYDCISITSFTIPNSINSISSKAFEGSGWFNNQPDGLLYLDKWLIGYKGESPIGKLDIKEGTIGIAGEAFRDCGGLTTVTIPNSVENIGGAAFRGCDCLITLTIPNSVTNIGPYAFYGCSGLTSVNLSSNLKCLENYTFSGCNSIISLEIPNNVVKIGDSALSGCSSLSSIHIPISVVSIGDQSFANCKKLESIIIPNSIKSIGEEAFINCSGLISISIPNSVISLGKSVFRNCYNINSVYITDLYDWCNLYTNTPSPLFSSNYHLYLNEVEIEQLTIPESITSLGNYVFSGCCYITSVCIPNSIASIGENAFVNCSGMASLKLPDNLQIIKKASFKGCSNLKSLTIPANVEFIYQEAFANCDALESLKVKSDTPPFLYDNSFSDFSVPLEVPKGCKENYQTAQGWKNFTNISESDKGCYKLIYLVDNEEYKSYKIEEGAPISPEEEPEREDYTFSGWSEIPDLMPAKDVTIVGNFIRNTQKGDANDDGNVDAADIVEMVRFIIGNTSEKFSFYNADVNEDGEVNTADVVKLVNIIMGE